MISKHLWAAVSFVFLAGGMLSAEPFDIQAVDTGTTTTVPLDEYRAVSSAGIGINTQAHVGAAPRKGFQAIADVSAMYNFTTEDGTALWDFNPAAGAAFYVPLSEAWFVGGQAGYGVSFHLATGEWDSGVTGPKWYSDQFFFVAAEAGWTLQDFGTLYLRPRYELFVQEGTAGHIIKTDIGYRYSLGGND